MFLLWRKTPHIDVCVYIYIWLDAVKWMEHRHSGTRLSAHGKARKSEEKPGLKK